MVIIKLLDVKTKEEKEVPLTKELAEQIAKSMQEQPGEFD